MTIPFTSDDWTRIKDTYQQWWAGELDRPLFNVQVLGHEADRPEPNLPNLYRTAQYPMNVPAAEIIDRWDYELCKRRFPGDAFPAFWPDFGPGAVAAFLGARPQVDEKTVWFHPPDSREVTDLHFTYDPDHPWARRIDELLAAARIRWGSAVQLAMTDLGGTLDILSTFRPSESLLLDLYDYPEDVERVTWEIHEAWWRYYDRFSRASGNEQSNGNPGYSAWTSIYSQQPYYMLQCDIAYTLSPQMFNRFVLPELTASCRRLPNAFYHLDGVGQLAHLDALLAIEELRGIQWVPGDGKPDATHWPEIYKRIRDAGKLIQVFERHGGGIHCIDKLANQLGDARGILLVGLVPRSQEDALHQLLERHDASTIPAAR